MEKVYIDPSQPDVNTCLGISDEREAILSKHMRLILEERKRQDSFMCIDCISDFINIADSPAELVYLAYQAGRAVYALS